MLLGRYILSFAGSRHDDAYARAESSDSCSRCLYARPNSLYLARSSGDSTTKFSSPLTVWDLAPKKAPGVDVGLDPPAPVVPVGRGRAAGEVYQSKVSGQFRDDEKG